MEPIGRMLKVDDNPKYAGIYYRLNKQRVKTFYINYRVYGKPVFEKIGREDQGITKSFCHQIRSDRVTAEKKGEAVPTGQAPTLDRAFEIWYDWALTNLKSKFIPSEESRYAHHIKPYLGHLKLNRITPRQIEGLKKIWKANLQDQSVHMVMGLITRIYKRMDTLGIYTGLNPMDKVVKINAKVHRKRFLSVEQAFEILNQLRVKDRNSYYQACFAMYAGLRKDEIMRLIPLNIDMHRRVLTIHQVKDRKEKGRTRSVHINDELAKVIMQIQGERKFAPGEKIFKSFKGHVFQKVFAPLNEGVDPKDKAHWVSFYTFRHSYASWLVAEGEHLKVVQEMLGHKELQITANIYAHVAPDSTKKAQDRLAERLKQVKQSM